MEVIIEPWPYGSLEIGDEPGRYFQGLVYARDTRNGNNPDSNFYSFPVPIIPVVDYHKRELVKIEKLATGGKGDPLTRVSRDLEHPLAHCTTAEYVPELLKNGVRKDLKELSVLQPDGPSFTVSDGSLVEWQKWRFRVSFTAREGVVIHDVQYDNRSVFYRLSISEMVNLLHSSRKHFQLRKAKTVPYADPRAPFHRKQAFDFGEGGAGMCANNLSLGCDCLGVIKVSPFPLIIKASLVTTSFP
jgi:primary-amine oxidase